VLATTYFIPCIVVTVVADTPVGVIWSAGSFVSALVLDRGLLRFRALWDLFSRARFLNVVIIPIPQS